MRYQILGITALAGLALVSGCGSSPRTTIPSGSGGTTGAGTGSAGTNGAGTAGTTGAGTAGTGAGTAGTTGADTAGTTGAGTAGTGAGTAGTGGTGTAGTTGAGGTGTAGTTGAGGATVAGGPITKVLPTAGCGMAPTGYTPGTLVPFHIATAGMKSTPCADSKCGAWTDMRDYWVRLPTGYDMTKAYPILFEGPGCGGHGNNLYALPGLGSTVIRVGVSPSAQIQAFHATNPGQGCFDDKEGDDSVDWVLYEALYDKLASQICFDRNRVFAGGNSSGAWFSNELGCKYAGDATRPVRGIMPNTGGLPTDPKYVPTCTTKPMSGFWSHEVNDGTNPFMGNIVAMNRALTVNGCTPAGVTYGTAMFDPFPISATDSTSCKKYRGCPAEYPLVVCPLPGNQHASHDNVVNPGWDTFIKLFLTAPLL
jgi:hypothetical protein